MPFFVRRAREAQPMTLADVKMIQAQSRRMLTWLNEEKEGTT